MVPWWWPFERDAVPGFVVMRYTSEEPLHLPGFLLPGLRVFVVAHGRDDAVPRNFPISLLCRGSYRRYATLRIRCDLVFNGTSDEERVLPADIHARHDGRHPAVHHRLLLGRLAGRPFFMHLPWRDILERLEMIVNDCEYRSSEWVLVIHCICARGRHRSVASAVCLARVLEQFGAAAFLMVRDVPDARGRPRMCGHARCPCNTGSLVPDRDFQSYVGPWLNGIARSQPMLPHVEVETDHWPRVAMPYTSSARYG